MPNGLCHPFVIGSRSNTAITDSPFDVDDLDAGEKAVLEFGATRAGYQPGKTFRVFLDPVGHPFCLCQA